VIHVAAGLGNCSVVSRAVSMGQAVNSTCRLRGETSAMLAAAGGHVEVLRWLLRAKADLSLRARDGSTALRCAQRCGQKEVVRLLEDPLSRLA
ncbi:ANK2, partial [Symbiodinium microadriaticum]